MVEVFQAQGGFGWSRYAPRAAAAHVFTSGLHARLAKWLNLATGGRPALPCCCLPPVIQNIIPGATQVLLCRVPAGSLPQPARGPSPPHPTYLTTLQSPSLQLLNGPGRKKSKCFEMVVVRIISFASKERDDDRGSGWDGIEMPGLKSCTLIKLQPGLCWSMTVMINIKLGIAA